MKNIFSLLFLLTIVIIFPQQSLASTHNATDGTNSGTLEMTPNDPPYAGQTTKLKFNFSGTSKGFTIGKCDCSLEIVGPGRLPSRLPVTLQNATGPDVNYVTIQYLFPSTATYRLTLTAQPKTTGTFQPFTLSWNVTTQKNDHLVPYSNHQSQRNERQMMIWGFVAVAVLILAILLFRKTKKPQKEKQ